MSEQELFEELSARLPYGVKVDVAGAVCTLNGVYKDYKGVWRIIADCEEGRHYDIPLDNCKMYLRPLETMTDKEREDANSLAKRSLCRHIKHGVGLILRNVPHISRYLYKHHLDVNRLIEQGDAFKAPEGMYKF